jgi:hypothetical protein
VNLEPPSGHLGQIENLIDQVPKVIGRSLDAFDRFYLTGSQFTVNALAKQIDKTNDRVQRGPELVGHVCEELALHPVDAEQLRRKPFELLRPLYEATGLPTFVTQYQSETENSRKGHDPPNKTSPVIESDRE